MKKIFIFPSLYICKFLSSLNKRFLFPPLNDEKVIFFKNARNAIWNSIKILNITSKDNVLMPSYNCGAEIDPFVKSSVGIKYYKIDENMKIDYHSLRLAIDVNTKAILIVYYFGFSHDVDLILSICKEYDLFLIEDCSHALFSKYNDKYFGTFGDIGIYSMWKTLPIPDGGALITDSSHSTCGIETVTPVISLSYLRRLKYLIVKNSLLKIVTKRIKNIILGCVKPLKTDIIKTKNENNCMDNAKPKEIDFEPDKGNWGISKLSMLIMQSIDYEEIKERRRENFKFLLSKLREFKKIKLIFKDLPEGICPSFFPFITESPKKLHEFMMLSGVETIIFWSDFHHEYPKDLYEDAVCLKTHTLALPIHQDLGIKDMDFIVRKLFQWEDMK